MADLIADSSDEFQISVFREPPLSRSEHLERIRSKERWDIVVVGGGATGLGTAVDSASRGYRTLLIDSHDFAKGTSSRSTKLIHGGVRYLAQGNISLVREALYERGLLLQNAPHIVHELPFVIPGYSRWALPYYGLGLRVYDWLAGRLPHHRSRTIGRDETLRLLPTIHPDNLRGGVLYHDGQFDDCRLAIALAQTAENQGATVLNYVRATGFRYRAGRLCAVLAEDVETGETFDCETQVAINATGVFADEVRRLDDPQAPSMLRPSRGVHIVLAKAFLPGEAALMVPKTDDGRVIFAIPWEGRLLVGTTDTAIDRSEIEPKPSEEEVEYLLEHVGRYFTRKPERSDVRSVFAGLRPLLGQGKTARTSALSREHVVTISQQGLLTVTGGKWTTYRRMAEDAIEKAVEWADLPRRPCVTQSLLIQGWTESPASGFAGRYGAFASDIEKLAETIERGSDPIHPNLPYARAEVAWGARFESARTVEDVLARRTRSLLLDARAAVASAEPVAKLLQAELSQTDEWAKSQVESFRVLAEGWI